MLFEELIGNDNVKNILKNTIEKNRIVHSYLFIGPNGIGKTLFAKEFARMILCNKQEYTCTNCKSCIQFLEDNHPDFSLIKPEDGTIKIEKIRQMQSKILEKPISSTKKVYVIKNADLMTKQASNCLLKTLEEPPPFVTIILTGTNENLFLNTIRSRCTKIQFSKISDNELKNYLEEKYNYENLSIELIKAFNGSITNALKIYEQRQNYEEIEKIFSNIEKYKLVDVLGKLDCLYKNRENIEEILDYISIIFYKKSLQNKKYIQYIETIEKVKKSLKSNSNYDMSIDRLVFKLWEEAI